jgi:hypothetical protein
MKRLIIHLLIGVITFSIGVTARLIFNVNRYAINAPKSEAISVPQDANESPAQISITLPTPEIIFDYDPKEFNPRGDYFILGRKPKEFREFDCLELAVDDFYGRASGNVMIQTYANQMYNAHYKVSGSVTKERLTFVAMPVFEEDFEYRFDGYFLRSGVLSGAGKYQTVLKGRLSKSRGGVKLAETEVGFRIEYLGC